MEHNITKLLEEDIQKLKKNFILLNVDSVHKNYQLWRNKELEKMLKRLDLNTNIIKMF